MESVALFEQAIRQSVIVPVLFHFEIRNLLWTNLRRGTLSKTDIEGTIGIIRQVNPEAVDNGQDNVLMKLAIKHNLTIYDASYLALAMDRNLPLATYDKALRRAAEAERVTVL